MAKKEVVKNDVLTVRVDADPTVDAIENAIDIVESIPEGVEAVAEEVVTIIRNNPYIIAGAAIIGLSIGGFVGYRYAVKKVTEHYEEYIQREIDSARKFYTRLHKEGEYETPEKAVESLAVVEEGDPIVEAATQAMQAMQDYRGISRKAREETVVEVETSTATNVFEEARVPDAWNYEWEIQQRDTTRPYVISKEEFLENGVDHEQSTLAYFAEDDIVSDERDQPVDDTENTVGDDNLLRFGHGSGDAKIVYIRNERLAHDFEIVHSEGSYAREVLGIIPESELRHSGGRRFRQSADE